MLFKKKKIFWIEFLTYLFHMIQIKLFLKVYQMFFYFEKCWNFKVFQI
jgi:hypothetical protein